MCRIEMYGVPDTRNPKLIRRESDDLGGEQGDLGWLLPLLV